MESSRRGISLLDLFILPGGTQALLPDQVAAQLEALAVLDHRATVSRDTFVHHGQLQSIGEGFALPGLRDWLVEIPGINTGIPFQLIFTRSGRVSTLPAETLEPAPTDFQLDLFLDRFAIRIPGLEPATVEETPGGPTHLVRDRTRDTVKLIGGAIFRLKSNGDAISAQFVDSPDPLDPAAATGFVAGLTFDPPSFFFGGSEFGMTADRVLYDGSEQYTPPAIVERGHGADWMGVSIKEATVYFPPSVGHLSIGVRDLLLGHPFGLQLEVRVEFGFLNLETFSVTFTPVDGGAALPITGTGQARTVEISGDSAQVTGEAAAGFLPTGDTRTASGLWTLPNHAGGGDEPIERVGLTSGPFEVRDGDVVRFQPRALEGDTIAGQFPELVYTFEKPSGGGGGGSTPAKAPLINFSLNGHDYANVVNLIGPADKMTGSRFNADVAAGEGAALQWKIDDGRLLATGPQLDGDLLPAVPGPHTLTLRDPSGNHIRRVLIEIVESAGELLIGAQAGVFNSQNTRVDVQSVRSVYNLEAFHASGARTTVDAPRPPVAGGTVSVPEGQLVLAVIEARESAPPVQPPPPPERLIIPTNSGMVFGQAVFLPGQVESLREFLRPYQSSTEVQVVVVGRADDLWSASTNLDRRREHNAQLAEDRARAARTEVVSILGGEGSAGSRVFIRGEQTAGWLGSAPAAAVLNQFSPADQARVTTPMWAIEHEHADFVANSPNLLPETPPRPDYRVVEVWLVRPAAEPTPTNGAGDPQETSTSHMEILIPGPDRTAKPPAPRPRDQTQANPRGWRFRLIVKWDSPTLVSLADALPTLAEILIEWEGDRLELPAGGGSAPPVSVPFSRREVFAITGRWSYDPRSGEMLFSIRVESRNDPDGLFPTIDVAVLAAVFAFGPALLAAVDPPEPGSAVVAIGALFVACGFLTEKLPGMDQPLIPKGKIAIRAIQAEQRLFLGEVVEESRTRVTVDYAVELGFAISSSLLDIDTDPDKPIRVKYKNVGFEVKWKREGGVTSFDGVFENVSFEIEDPGQWTISGPVGELLRVTGSRAGTGSSWFEFDLAFSIDLGVVSLTNAVVRLIFPDGGGVPDIELRGLGVAVNIPGVLEGAGRMAFGAGGDIRGAIEARIIPAKLQVVGAVTIQVVSAEDFTFVFVQVGVLFPVGIPLAQSGLALYGLVGRFVSNGRRALPASADPIEREILWHALPPENKYTAAGGQWALGLGAVIGTMPDTGFSFNALGMLAISFPDVSVVFGIDAKFMSQPSLAAETRPPASPADFSFKLLGIVAIDSQAIKVGIRGSLDIPDVLKLRVPISAYFPIHKTPELPFDAYLRVGSDGFHPPSPDLGLPRLGDTVTLQFLPSTLNARVWSYMMFEEKRLYALGGDPRFDFTGFSVGFGAGFDIEWGGGPVHLAASARILIGVGSKPLSMVGGIFVRGELWLVIVGVSVSGELLLKLNAQEQRVSGKFCGKVSFFFFSVKGCVKFDLGTEPGLDIPFPGLFAPKLDLTDRRGVVTGSLTAPETFPPSADVPAVVPVVWPDTVPVIGFQHHLRAELDSASNVAPVSQQPPTAPLWSGASDLKYTFRLTGVELWQQVGGTFQKLDPPLPAGWWWPTHRPGLLAPGDGVGDGPATPSEHEGRQLALLTWEPGVWAQSLTDGGAGTPGDPAGTVGRICDPAAPLDPVCARGKNARRIDFSQVRIPPDGRGPGPYFDYFEVTARETFGAMDLETAAPLLDELGLYLVAGQVIAIANPITAGGAYEITAAYRYMRFIATAVFRARFSTPVVHPVLLLALAKSRLEEGGDPDTRICVNFINAKPFNEPATVLKHEGIVFTSPEQRLRFAPAFGSGEIGLRCPVDEVTIQLPGECGFVSVRIDIKGSAGLKVEILDAAGSTIGGESSTYTTAHTFDFNQGKISAVRMRGVTGQPVTVVEVCYSLVGSGPAPSTGEIKDLIPKPILAGKYDDLFVLNPPDDIPEVIGILPDDTETAWKGAVIAEDAQFRYVEYVTPGADTQPWKGFRISAWMRSRVAVVNVCANTTQAAQQQQDEQNNHNDLVVVINGLFNDPDPLANHYLLERSRLYQVRVRWQWAGWRKSEDEPAPPDPLAAGFASRWQPEVTQFFYFRTAAETPATTTPPPANLIDETIFDPRGALRYFLGFEVAAQPDTHLLDDKIKAHFSVKHLKPLMDKYGYTLDLEIRRTDMPPGTRKPGPQQQPLQAGYTLVWQALEYGLLARIDQRLLDAAAEAPCLDGFPTDGTTGEIDAELLPNAEYDLLLLAKQTGGELIIARTHFYTSRYANATDILNALGYPTSGAVGYTAPLDLVTTAPLPADLQLGNDAGLDGALRDAGLDPFPLANGPRTSLLWHNNAGTWELAGVLVESDEPLRRMQPRLLNDPRPAVERLNLTDVELRSAAGLLATCTPIRSNETFTRVLLRPTAPLTAASLTGAVDLTLVARLNDKGTIVSGRRALAGAPVFMAEVV